MPTSKHNSTKPVIIIAKLASMMSQNNSFCPALNLWAGAWTLSLLSNMPPAILTHSMSAAVGGLALGLLAAAVLLINNHRDVEADMRIGRSTLAIVAGPRRTVWVYTGLMLLPFVLLATIAHALPRGHVWPALMALPVALALIYRFIHEPPGRGFNRILVWTAQLQLLFGLLLSLGLVL